MARVTVTTHTFEGTAEEVARLLRLHQEGEAARLAQGKDASAVEALTMREFDVGRRMLAGKKRREIAHELQINEDTVKTHAANLYSKLGIHRKAELRAFSALFAER